MITQTFSNFDLIADLIEKYQVTQMVSAPALTHAFIQHLEAKNAVKKLDSLQQIYMGGSIVTVQLREKLESLLSAQIGVLYAMTETAALVTVSKPNSKISMSVGQLTSNMKAKVCEL